MVKGVPLTGLQRLVYGPDKLVNHCHLWKNARDGGILVSQQAILMENINIIKTKLFCSIEMTPISPPSMYVPIALATYLASV